VQRQTDFSWVMSALGASPALIGLLAPIRQAGALDPQLAISGQIRQFPIRKWFWVASAAFQILALGSMIVAAVLLAFGLPRLSSAPASAPLIQRVTPREKTVHYHPS
jgi:hypothetical protein